MITYSPTILLSLHFLNVGRGRAPAVMYEYLRSNENTENVKITVNLLLEEKGDQVVVDEVCAMHRLFCRE